MTLSLGSVATCCYADSLGVLKQTCLSTHQKHVQSHNEESLSVYRSLLAQSVKLGRETTSASEPTLAAVKSKRLGLPRHSNHLRSCSDLLSVSKFHVAVRFIPGMKFSNVAILSLLHLGIVFGNKLPGALVELLELVEVKRATMKGIKAELIK